MSKTDTIKPQELQVSVPEKQRAGVYANTTNITVTGTEYVFNFIYANPQDTPNGTLVSRVIVNKKHAQQILETLKSIVSTDNEVNPS